MLVVYYSDADLNICPVKKYFEQFKQNKNDSYEITERKLRILADIDQKIKFIAQNKGRPTPPISFPLHGYSFFEIKKRKNQNIVIRILYFRHEEKIVLLNAFEKPDNYSDKKTKKEINKHYQITNNYQSKFKQNPTLYENYPE